MQKWGKHIAAVAVFLVLTVVYFAPAVFEGKSIRQGDMEKAVGMGGSQMEKYEKSAQPGELAFGLMPCLEECPMREDMGILPLSCLGILY